MGTLLKIFKAVLFVIVFSLLNYLFLLAVLWLTPYIMIPPWWKLLILVFLIGGTSIGIIFMGLPAAMGVLIAGLSSRTVVELGVCGLASLLSCIAGCYGAWIFSGNIFGAVTQNILVISIYVSVFASLLTDKT
jgi:hypothetical protein